jgi:hypothetical protein
MNRSHKYYKLAHPNGWDFYTGKTINYRKNIGKTVSIKDMGNYELCSSSVIHASKNPNDCFIGAIIPCSAYEVWGKPVLETLRICGFITLKIKKEIINLDKLFGWKYSDALNATYPFQINPPKKIGKKEVELLKEWVNVRNNMEWSVRNGVWASLMEIGEGVGENVWATSVVDRVWLGVKSSVDRVMEGVVEESDNMWDSIRDSVWAYTGTLFPRIKKWKGVISHKKETYPFQSVVDLWYLGLVPSFDGKVWRLHGKPDGAVLWEGSLS